MNKEFPPETRKPSSTNRTPRTQTRDPRTQNPEPRTKNQEPRAQNPEPRAQNPEPRAQNPEPFNLYAQYYDLLYKDKDYKKEAEYLHTLIRKHSPNAKTILSLGCGTGNYEFELEKLGYEIVGVDISQQMIDIADISRGKSKCEFIQGDIRNIRLDKKFDVVISMFHVICYQTSNEDLLKSFKTASIHLSKDGIFLFDFWYGPAVLTDPPTIREKQMENDLIKVKRMAKPTMLYNENVVDVNFNIEIIDKATGLTQTISELHKMRYLFLPEMKLMMKNKFDYLQTYKWLSDKKNVSCDSWYGIICFKKGKFSE